MQTYIIGPEQNQFLLKLFLYLKKPEILIIDTCLPQDKNFKIINSKKYCWNKEGTKRKLELQSLAFKIFKGIDIYQNYILLSELVNSSKNLEMFIDIEKKVFLERISYILLLLGASEKFNKEKSVTLILPQSYKKIWFKLLNYLNKNSTKFPEINFPLNDLDVKFIGLEVIDFFIDYLKSILITLYFIFSIRNLKKNRKRHFKIGLLTWFTALKINTTSKESCGLDSVIPPSFNKKEVLIYSKTNLKPDYINQYKKKYKTIIFDKSEIFRNSSFGDVYELVKYFLRLLFKFPFMAFKLDPLVRNNIPKIIFNLLKWHKFAKLFSIDISISYNDYSISDLIRNKVFMKIGIQCWGYVHSATEYHLYSKSNLYPDPRKSLISFDRRYYLLAQQLDYFKLSNIKSKKNIVVGPFFQSYKENLNLDISTKNKNIISIFLCSEGDNVLHPISSHIAFLTDLLSLLDELDNNYLFLKKWKSKIKSDLLSEIINSKNLFKKNIHKKYIVVNDQIPSSRLINSSRAVISMAFTSPTIEALSLSKPAIFYDPIGIMRNNYIENFSGLYLTNRNSLKIFLNLILKKDNVDKFVNEKTLEIGMASYKLGVKKLHQDINSFIQYL